MSAALVRLGGDGGPQRSGRSDDGATGERQGAPGPADGPFATGAAGATLLARGAEAKAAPSRPATPSRQPPGVMGMSRERVQRRTQEEAGRRRIADEQHKLARNEAVVAAGMMARDDGRSGLVHRIVRDLGMDTELGSEFVNRNFIAERDAYYQRQARAEQHAAKERSRRADLEAERQRYSDAVGDTETGLYVGPTKEGKRLLESAANAERFYRLDKPGMAANEVERGWRQIQASSAIGRLEKASQTQAEIAADIDDAVKRAEQSRWRTKDQENILANKDRLERIADTEEKRALEDLKAAHAWLAQNATPPVLQKLDEAETAGEFIEVLVNHPAEFLAVKAGQTVPKVIARATGTALAGPLGGILAASYTAFGWKYAEAVVKGFEDRGIDLQDEAAVGEAVENKDLMREIYDDALRTARIAAGAQVTWSLVRYRLSAPQPSRR